jgi:hypothetical protein
MTLGNATARARLIVWCKERRHQVARHRGKGQTLRCRDDRAGVARPAAMLAMRRPQYRRGGDRYKAMKQTVEWRNGDTRQ